MQRFMILACLMMPVPALAQDGDGGAQVHAAAEQCIRSATDLEGRLACVGQPAAQCLEAAETPNTIARSICADAELTYWKSYLNRVYDASYAALAADDAEDPNGPRQAPAFEAAQKAWLGWRQAECTFAASQMRGGSGAGPVQIGCEMGLTGQRALQVEAELAGLTR